VEAHQNMMLEWAIGIAKQWGIPGNPSYTIKLSEITDCDGITISPRTAEEKAAGLKTPKIVVTSMGTPMFEVEVEDNYDQVK
jgi:hypothetical protein